MSRKVSGENCNVSRGRCTIDGGVMHSGSYSSDTYQLPVTVMSSGIIRKYILILSEVTVRVQLIGPT